MTCEQFICHVCVMCVCVNVCCPSTLTTQNQSSLIFMHIYYAPASVLVVVVHIVGVFVVVATVAVTFLNIYIALMALANINKLMLTKWDK